MTLQYHSLGIIALRSLYEVLEICPQGFYRRSASFGVELGDRSRETSLAIKRSGSFPFNPCMSRKSGACLNQTNIRPSHLTTDFSLVLSVPSSEGNFLGVEMNGTAVRIIRVLQLQNGSEILMCHPWGTP